MYCINCGKQIEDDSVFCLYCGAKVEGEEYTEIIAEKESGEAFPFDGALQNMQGIPELQKTDEEKTKKVGGKPKRGVIMAAITAAVILLSFLIGISIYNKPTKGNLAEQLDLGNRYLEEMDYEQAIVAFNRAIEIDPMSVDAHLGLVEAYIRSGEFEMALEAAKKGYDLTGDERLQEKIEMIESGNIFSSLGYIIKRTFYDEKGNLSGWHKYTYNRNEQQATVTAYDGSGNETGKIELVYDEKGRQIIGYSYGTYDGKLGLMKYYYEGEQLVKSEHYNDATENELTSYTLYECDEDGRISKEEEYDASGVLTRYKIPEYDVNGHRIKLSDYGSFGELMFYQTWELDENGNITRHETYSGDGRMNGYSVYEYDEDGNSLGGKYYDADGNLRGEW